MIYFHNLVWIVFSIWKINTKKKALKFNVSLFKSVFKKLKLDWAG